MCSKKLHVKTCSSVINHTYPKLYTGKEWFVGFNAFDPIQGKMRRKKIKLNHIAKASERRKYATGLIQRIAYKLDKGWNPWVETENSKAYHTFTDVAAKYKANLIKKHNDGALREKTLVDYTSKMRTLELYIESRKMPMVYIYQFDRYFVNDFLDYIYMDRNNSPRTRNNYLTWLSTFSTWLVQHMYLKEKPTEGLESIKRTKGRQKDRDVIPDHEMQRLHDYLGQENPHFLLACYFLHYVLVRPKEMSYIRIRDISIARGTLFISGDVSKNGKDAVVTLPAKVLQYMVDLKVFDKPGHYYLFSAKFLPGPERKSEKNFRDYWSRKVRPALGWGLRYKFYSLKDTGITNMLRSCDVVSVRDQARHSSILITDIYTPTDLKEANAILLNYEGIL